MTIETILDNHLARYASMQIQDVYKLIHQAAMGSGHAISNDTDARKWLERELREMGDGPHEPMIDPISDDGQIVRVHLRPFLAQGGTPEKLLNAFIRTANEFHGDMQTLRNYWNAATAAQYFPSAAMEEFIESMQAHGYPAVHHSPDYVRLYRPAYRVVWREFLITD